MHKKHNRDSVPASDAYPLSFFKKLVYATYNYEEIKNLLWQIRVKLKYIINKVNQSTEYRKTRINERKAAYSRHQ